MERDKIREELDKLDKPIILEELELAIEKLKNNKSPGPYSIPNEFIKNLPDSGKSSLLIILNNILSREIPPADWAESETVMIYKKENPEEPYNYRPIALNIKYLA